MMMWIVIGVFVVAAIIVIAGYIANREVEDIEAWSEYDW